MSAKERNAAGAECGWVTMRLERMRPGQNAAGADGPGIWGLGGLGA